MKTLTKNLIILAISLASVNAYAQPSVSANVPPTRISSNVISIFSNAYTNVTGTDFFPNWGQATQLAAQTIGATDNVLKYSNLNYQGIQFGSSQNCGSMTYLHLDVWTNDVNAAILPVTLIWTGGTANPKEKTVTKNVATNGSWTSLDIPLSEFTNADLATSLQLKFQSNEWYTLGAASNITKYTTVYLDNIYFYSNAAADTQVPVWDPNHPVTLSSKDETSVTLSLLASDNSGSVSYSISDGTKTTTGAGISGATLVTVNDLLPSTQYTFTVTLKDVSGNVAASTKQIVVTTSGVIASAATPTVLSNSVFSVYSNPYTSTLFENQAWYASSIKEVLTGSTTGTNKALKISSIDATASFGMLIKSTPTDLSSYQKLHLDIYPLASTTLQVGLISSTPGVEARVTPSLIPGQWNSVDLNLADIKAKNSSLDLTKVFLVGFWTLGNNVSLYLDNVLFYNGSYSVSNGINQVSTSSPIKCYVNSGKLLIVSSFEEISEITVCNLLGQNIKNEVVKATSKIIDLSSLSTGNYFLVAKMNNGMITTQKFSLK